MAQSITTILDKNPAGDLSLSDVLYIIQGTSSDRDRNVTLEKIRDFLAINWDDFKIEQTNFKAYVENGYFVVQNPGGHIKIKGNDIQYISPTMKQKFSLGSSSLTFLTDSGSTEAKYGNDEASVGSVTLDDDGVKVAGTGGSSALENDELKFSTSGGVSGSYYGSGFSITYGNVTLSAVNDATNTYFGIAGQGGGSKLYQDSLVISDGTNTTTVKADKISTPEVKLSSGNKTTDIKPEGITTNAVTSSKFVSTGQSGSTTITNTAIDCSGDVKGWLHSKHIYAAASNQTTVNQNLLDTSVFTAGVIVPIYAIPNTAGSWVNYYGSDGALHSFGVLQHHAVLLVCVGTATVNGSDVPAFCAVVDTNT